MKKAYNFGDNTYFIFVRHMPWEVEDFRQSPSGR